MTASASIGSDSPPWTAEASIGTSLFDDCDALVAEGRGRRQRGAARNGPLPF